MLLATDPSLFRVLIPWLIFFATVLFALSPQIAGVGERLAARRAAGSGPGPSATALQGAVAIYGGYFGAGMGIMMLATLSLTEGRDFHRLNAAKKCAGLRDAGPRGDRVYSFWCSGSAVSVRCSLCEYSRRMGQRADREAHSATSYPLGRNSNWSGIEQLVCFWLGKLWFSVCDVLVSLAQVSALVSRYTQTAHSRLSRSTQRRSGLIPLYQILAVQRMSPITVVAKNVQQALGLLMGFVDASNEDFCRSAKRRFFG